MDAPKLYDCFPFFNELDLLELRLRELDDVVDYFVLVEARQTFRGDKKPLYFLENKERFSNYAHKIRHLVVDSFPQAKGKWDCEIYQRNYLSHGLDDARPQDLVLLSDVDEIPKAEILAVRKADPPENRKVLCFELRWFFFYLNTVHRSQRWVRIGPRLARWSLYTSMQSMREVRAPVSGMRDWLRWLRAVYHLRGPVEREIIKDAGWHFTWMGGPEAYVYKHQSIVKHSRQRDHMDLEEAVLGIKNAVSENGYLDRLELDDSFPQYLRDNRGKFSHLLYDPE